MTFPGPEALGRGLVVVPGVPLTGNVTAAAAGWDHVRVDEALLVEGLAGTVERLHRAWANRRPLVVELDLPSEALARLRQPVIEVRPAA